MSESEGDGIVSDRDRVGAMPVEDAESKWLRARSRDPGAPPPSPALVRDHAQLEGELRNLPAPPVDESWHDDVLAAMRDHWRTTRRNGVARILVAAVALGILIWLWLIPPPRDSGLTVWTRQPDGVTLGDPRVGDHLMVQARLEADSDLRVYRDRKELRARCPGGPSCSASPEAPDETRIDLRFDLPGVYDVVLVVGTVTSAPEASMDAYLAAAQDAHAHIEMRQRVVR